MGSAMPAIPRESSPDSTLAVLADPYRFIMKRCAEHGTDLFEARLLLRRTICLHGEEAARLFYDETRFTRVDAAPGFLQATLFGRGGVQGLDGEAHRHRKAMLMDIVAPERVAQLAESFTGVCEAHAARRAGGGRIVLYDRMCGVITRAVCGWAGVPLPEEDKVETRTAELRELFDDAATVGLGHLRSRIARYAADD